MVFEGNNKIRRKIYQSIEGLTDDEFNSRPSGGGWSPKQILEHLTLMETHIATRILKEMKNPDSLRASKKLILLANDRVMNVELPEQTRPTESYKTIGELKEELHNSRIYLLDVYDASCKDALREKSIEHPNYGNIPLIQWFPFIGLYEKCHLKRLRKTIDELKMESRPVEPVGGRND
ncbi:hypothetical protein HNO89_002357 [Sporosarcina luteola]|nr:hypothetical protein [Sporosarcina luteola]